MEINNMMDVIDSRDIIERIEELDEILSDIYECNADIPLNFDEWVELNRDNEEMGFAEYLALMDLQKQCRGYVPDWEYGVSLIRYSYFTEYAMELLSDIGDLPREVPWYIVIDEEATAGNIKVDYTEVDFNGVVYFVR